MSLQSIQQKLEVLGICICDGYQDRTLADWKSRSLIKKLESQTSGITWDFLDILLLSGSLCSFCPLPFAWWGENGRHGEWKNSLMSFF